LDSLLKTKFANGLTVHLKEIHTAPIISHWVWYRIGSHDETAGSTGISHWVEHMQFKGTPAFPTSILDKAISREGGVWNAFTHLDWTAYYETLPADKIDLALHLEADRMVNSLYQSEEVEAERTVILAEREESENEPLFRLGEAIQAAAFPTHSYGHEVIGSRDDLLCIQRDDLYNHYRSFYTPQNALIAVAGDFNSQEMLDRLSELYAGLGGGELTRRYIPPAEPLPQAETRLTVEGSGETTFVQVSYRAPAGSNPDFFAFTVLDSLLSGPTSLNMFGGGGISNKTSRLYRSLVENELAINVHGGLQATIDPFLYDVHITIHPNSTPYAVLSAFDDEIKRLQDTRVSQAEVKRAIKQARALFAYGSENITNQAFWLGYADMFASYDWFTGYLEALDRISPEDIQHIARTYLVPSCRVVGTYLPTGEEVKDDEPDPTR